MKFTQSWLKKFLDTNANVQDISAALTEIGIEVEKITDRSEELSSFITAEITAIRKHPNADKLNLCMVNYGTGSDEIVCGAHNVRKGLKVVLAPLGTIMPNSNIKIEKRKIRGVESVGMLCSATELGIGTDSDGIIELDEKTEVGKKLLDVWNELSDPLIEVEVTPNRSDCLGVYGIARDLAAYGVGKLKEIKVPDIKSTGKDMFDIKVLSVDKCPLFIARFFSDVQIKDSSESIQNLLKSIGEQPISSAVDITNYMSYAFGRPMHVYDADKICGKLRIVELESAVDFAALDGKIYHLAKGDLVVMDDKKVCSIAGIIGGESSKCEETTKNILLEAAVFDRISVAKTARRLNIDTRSKYVFERGVDHHFTKSAVDIASEMLVNSSKGSVGFTSVLGGLNSGVEKIRFRLDKISKITGVQLDNKKSINILNSLGFTVKDLNKDEIEVTVPSWRHDVRIEEDIVEEIVRIYGFHNIAEKSLPVKGSITSGSIGVQDKLMNSVRSLLSFSGYDELITWCFMSSDVAKKFGSYNENMLIANPISEDLDLLRGSILPNMLSAVQRNNSRSFENLAFFEIGPVYGGKFSCARETNVVSALMSGQKVERNIYKDEREFDFFDAKSSVLQVLELFGISEYMLEFSTINIPSWYHPGKSSLVKFNGKNIAYLGEIHPSILKDMKISNATIGFEIFVDNIPKDISKGKKEFISEFQMVSRDFAFIVDSSVKAGTISKGIESIDSNLIRRVSIFDVFEGEKLGDSKKSIALNVILQSEKSTLTEQELNNVSDRIISYVKKKLGGTIR